MTQPALAPVAKLWKIVVLIGGLSYVASMALPAWDEGGVTPYRGFEAFLMALLLGASLLAWAANPLAWAALVFIARHRPVPGAITAATGVACAVIGVLAWYVETDMTVGPGVYLWIVGIMLIGLGGVVAHRQGIAPRRPDDESIAAGIASEDAAPRSETTSGGRRRRSWVGIAVVAWLTSYPAALVIGSRIIPGSSGAEIAIKIFGVFIVAAIMGALAAGVLSRVRGRREWAATVVLTFAGVLPVVGIGPWGDPCPTNERPAIPAGLAYATRHSAVCIVTSRNTIERIYQGGGSSLGDLTWSPDGSELAVDDLDRPEGARWVIMSADGSGRRAVADRPSWVGRRILPLDVTSPDGAWVARHDPYEGGITVRPRDGGDDWKISGGMWPTWSPDSEWIAYQAGGDWRTHPNVLVVRRDTPSSRSLLAVEAHSPAWRPAVGP